MHFRSSRRAPTCEMGLMDIPELFLKLWGLWPIDTLETPRKRKIYLAYRVIVIGWYSAFNFSYFIGTLRIIIDQEPFERISKCLSVFVSIGLLLWKGLIYLRNNIAQICIQVRGAETPLRNSADQNVKVAYTRTEASNKYLNVYIIGSTFSTLVAYAGVSCIEVYNTGPDYWKMDNVSFMHEIYLPIDKLKWRWWIMVANIATACESVVVNIAVQSSFCTLVMYGSLRLKVLRIGMQRFHRSPCGGVNMKSFVVEHLDSIRLIANREPSERISKCLSVFLSIGLLLVKGLLYLKNNISQLCIKVTESEGTFSNSLDRKIKEAYKRTELTNNYLNYYILGSTFSTLIAYAGVSCIEVHSTGPDYWKMDNVSFMHEIYLPVDKLKWRWWIMVANIATACESVVVNIAVQSSYCALVMYGSLRLEVLRIGLKKFHNASCNVATVKIFVVEHIDSIRYIDDLNEATKSILFITFLLNSIKVASVLFPLMAVKSLSALAFPAIFSSMLVAEVFYLGWICNEVKEQSLKISTDAYKILWYNENKDVSILLQMMIRRAQRPLTMQMGPFGPMVTDTILSTMKAAYSYTTLMLNARE